MKRSRRALGCGLVFLLAGPGLASAEEPPARRDPARMSVADISACMRANVAERGSLRDIELRSVDREGAARTIRMRLFWKPAAGGAAERTVLQVSEPAEAAGAAFLAVAKPEGDDVYMYLPLLAKVQRVSGGEHQPLFGTDLSYAELEQVQKLVDAAHAKRVADARVFERAAFVLEVTGAGGGAGYSRIASYVDQATCTLLKAEFFSGTELRKVLAADVTTLVEVEPWWLILGYTIENRRSGTSTALSLSNVYLREHLPEELFDPASFYRVTP